MLYLHTHVINSWWQAIGSATQRVAIIAFFVCAKIQNKP